eukprot:gene7152-14565_t
MSENDDEPKFIPDDEPKSSPNDEPKISADDEPKISSDDEPKTSRDDDSKVFADNDHKATPSAKAAYMGEGYNQTYIIMNNGGDVEAKPSNGNHNVFFRCGNWCYRGPIQFNGLKMDTSTLPVLIPMLQRQQSSLRYYCTSKSVPEESEFFEPLSLLNRATQFIGDEITSEHVEKELKKWSSVFSWIDDDSTSCYFELVLEPPECMKDVALVASKTYVGDLIIISLYFDRTVYFIIQAGDGDQPLLDVRFPDVSKHGQGLHISSYKDTLNPWRKLTLWHIMAIEHTFSPKNVMKPKTINLSSPHYLQTYCILKGLQIDSASSRSLSLDHDVLFRFGSWCYAGRVQLTPVLTLADIPYVIPALRLQQSKMDFLCDVNTLSAASPFAAAMEYMMKISPLIEDQITQSEDALTGLIDRLARMGLGDSVAKWLEGDPGNSFFEFRVSPDADLERIFHNMELVASKCYHASGIVTITIVFQYNIYVTVLDAGKENPLLDSRFPDVSGKGRGYQLQAFKEGIPGWTHLRKVSVWQTIGALEQEFRERTARLAQSKQRAIEHTDGDGDEGMTDESEADSTTAAKGIESNETKAASRDVDVDVDETDAQLESPGAAVVVAADAKTQDKNKRKSFVSETGGASEKAVSNGMSTAAVTASSNETKATAKDTSSTTATADGSSGRELNPLLASRAARPHHLPKLGGMADANLAKKLAEMRKAMGTDEGDAPWDASGRPKGLSSLSKK